MKKGDSETRGLLFVDALLQDARYAARTLRKSPGFTITALLTLTIGIGANTAIFSIADRTLLEPLPYPSADRIVMLMNMSAGGRSPIESSTRFQAWADKAVALEDLAAYRLSISTLTGAGDPDAVVTLQISNAFFRLFHVPIADGRAFTSEEDQPGRAKPIILSYGFWQRRFGGDVSALGRTVSVNGEPRVIVGIVAAPFATRELPYLMDADVWEPLQLDPSATVPAHYLAAAARLKTGASAESVRHDAVEAWSTFRQRFPDDLGPFDGFATMPLREAVVGDTRSTLRILLGVVAFVLLIACANIASFLLARSLARSREFAIRAALGASRARILNQILVESGLLALVAGAIGLVFGEVALHFLAGWMPTNLARLGEVGLDWRVFTFTAVLSIVAGPLCGVIPALEASKADPNTTISLGSRDHVSHRRISSRSALVVVETALATVLLIGAGLLLRTFAELRAFQPGFDPHRVLTLPMPLTGRGYENTSSVEQLARVGLDRVRNVSGVQAAAVGCCAPMVARFGQSFEIEGRPPDQGAPLMAGWITASPGYFEVFKIPILRGRVFTRHDDDGAPGVAIINELMARRYWPTGDPLHDRLLIGRGLGPEWSDLPREVVGIVGNVPDGALNRPSIPMIYVPVGQVPDRLTALHARTPLQWFVRTSAEPSTVSAAVQHALVQVTGVPVARVYIRTMDALLSESMATTTFQTMLVSIFAACALLLAAIGVNGVASYSLQQRTSEIGVRLALGADPSRLRNVVAWQELRVALVGIASGLTSAYVLGRLLTASLFGVTVHDPITFITGAFVLVASATVSVWVPARRAAHADPMVALRAE